MSDSIAAVRHGRRRARHVIAAITACAAMAAVGGVATGASGASPGSLAVRRGPVVVTCRGAAQYRPSHYVLACGDGNAYWSGVKWSTWAHTALGRGMLVLNSCHPNCAAGQFHSYPAVVRLNRYMIVVPVGPLYCAAVITYRVGRRSATYTAVLPT
jgi:hypothetical protein